MPNWFYFEMQVSGTKKDVLEFVENVKGSEKFETEGRDFDFNHFIPQPENIFRANLSFDKQQELKESGIPDWYNWNNDNWGTKWNVAVDDVNVCVYNDGSADVFYTMRTAWAFPTPVIEQMIRDYHHLNFSIQGEEESVAYGVNIDSSEGVWEEEEPIFIDENNGKQVYWDSNDCFWRYSYNDSIVPNADDFYPITQYSWS